MSNQEEREDEDIFDDANQNDDDTKDSNKSKGDEQAAEVLSEGGLQEYNKRVGKSYKSWDDVAKSEKERDKAFAQKGKKEEKTEVKTEVKPSKIDDEVVEELLLTKHPEAEHVLDELKDVAEQKGVSVLKLFRESKYFQGEAKAIADAKKIEEDSKGRVGSPSNGTGGNSGAISFANIDLANKKHTEWLGAKEGRRQEYMDWYATHK